MKKIIFYLAVLSAFTMFSQEVTFSVGTNYTDYSFDDNQDFEASGMGSHIDVGYTKKIGKTKTEKSLKYSLSLNLNQYNASSGNMTSHYSWETSYIGIRNGLELPLYTKDNSLKLDALFGVNVSTIVKGQQTINSMVYDISDHSEFCGLTGWADLGLNLSYEFNDGVKLALGYSISEKFDISGKSADRESVFYDEDADYTVNMNNSRINLSLIYKIN
ncbi:hypothetical protein N8376_00630 [Flavobacteriaceae bacterium]|nr:hypothetical protein [Flavobacteriaceae bacterium]